MGFLRALFGFSNNVKSKPYTDDGFALSHALIDSLCLPGWQNGRPFYSQLEQGIADRSLADFQQIANVAAGDDVRFHPEIIEQMRRNIIASALAEFARTETLRNDNVGWREILSTYLKAWAGNLDPIVLVDAADLLARRGYTSEARQALRVLDQLPAYLALPANSGFLDGRVLAIVDERSRELELRYLAERAN